jgi:hypothetical protein
MCGGASASITYTEYNDRISVDGEDVNLTDVWNELVADQSGNSTYVNENALEQVSTGVWVVKSHFYCFFPGTNMRIESPDCTELRLAYKTNGYDIDGYINFNGTNERITVYSWNDTSNTPYLDPSTDTQIAMRIHGNITGTNFNGIWKLLTGFRPASSFYYEPSGKLYSDILINSSYNGWNPYGNNLTISNITIQNNHEEYGYGISGGYIDDSYINNFTAFNVSDHISPSTGAYGIQIVGDNNILSNISVNGTGWSGTNFVGNNNTISDIFVTNTGHNGIEFSSNFSTLINAISTYSDYYSGANEGNAYYIDGDGEGYPRYHEITMQNCTADHYTGTGLKIGYDAYNISLFNMDFSGYGIQFNGIENAIAKNITSSGLYYGIQFGDGDIAYSNNITIIDSNLQNTGFGVNFANGTNVNFANVNLSSIYFDSGNYTNLYPLNVRVLNTANYPVQNANLTLSVTTFGLDGLGNYFASVQTDENGYPESPIYVPDYLKDSVAGYTYYNLNTVTAEKSGESDTSAAFNPDETWYSENSSSPNGTLIILTLDVEGEGEAPLSISSFTPLDTTPTTTNGTEQTFTIDLTKTGNVTWYIDSNEVQTNNSVSTASYTNSTASVGTYNVTVIATDGVTEVNQTWIWTVTEYWTPTPGTHYIGVPETSTWSAGSWITTFSGTYTEEQTEVTGVEVRP